MEGLGTAREESSPVRVALFIASQAPPATLHQVPRGFFSQLRRASHSAPALSVTAFVAALFVHAIPSPSHSAPRDAALSLKQARKAHGEARTGVLDWALWNLSKYYVDPQRIDPQRMGIAGAEALEESIPEVLVIPDEDKKMIEVRAGKKSQRFPFELNAIWSVRARLREIFDFVTKGVKLDPDQRRKAEYDMVDAVLATLDPHTNLMRADAFAQLKESTKGSFGGLGIEVGVRKNAITILRVIDGNPAQKAGLLARDRIVQIDDESAVALDLSDAVSLLRGKPGSTVRVYVERGNDKTPKRFDVTRAEIKLESVTADLLPASKEAKDQRPIGVLRLARNFARNTGAEVRKALKSFEKDNVQGVILDMRSNPGGLLDAAVEVADAFLSAGTIVSTVGAGTEGSENQATKSYDFLDRPVVVLVDQSSASATEIVAGALRNLDRAVILGRRTFGKGSVQVPNARKVDGKEIALKMTIAQYLTPGNVSIQSVGVSPDLETRPVNISDDSIAYYSSKRFDLLREESLSAHLDHATAEQQKSVAGPLHFLAPNYSYDGDSLPPRLAAITGKKKRADFLLKDPEVRIARNLITSARSPDRRQILDTLPQFAQAQQGAEDQLIAGALKKQGIDWQDAPKEGAAAAPQLSLSVESDAANNEIEAGKSASVKVTVRNQSTSPAYRVRAMVSTDNPSLDERELLFGTIEAGKSKSASFKVSVGAYELSRSDRLDFALFSDTKKLNQERELPTLTIHRKAKAKPSFVLSTQIIDDPKISKKIRGNGDGKLQVGEKAWLGLNIGNVGSGDAPEVRASLRAASADGIFWSKSRQKVGKIPSQKEGFVYFPVTVKRQPKAKSTKVRLAIVDNELGEYLSHEVEIPVLPADAKSWGSAPKARKISGPALAYAQPNKKSQAMAALGKGNYKVLAEQDGWARVKLSNDRVAFVPPNPQSSADSELRWLYEVSPPTLTLDEVPTTTTQKEITISGLAQDEQAVLDLYITVINPARKLFSSAEKVYYLANEGEKPGLLRFSHSVPLTPGSNLIEVVARQNSKIVGRKRVWVLCTKNLTLARNSKTLQESKGKLSVDTLK